MTYQWNHAIITGGGSGLGHGVAVRLLKRGTHISVLDLAVSPERATALDAAAAQGGGSWRAYTADTTDAAAIGAAIGAAIEAYGAPDLAINFAGIGSSQTLADMNAEHFQRVVQVNLFGSFNFAKAVLPHIPAGGRLALVSSLAGIASNYAYSAYSASKFGVLGLASTLRQEYEPLGIHISCICPPEVKTPMVEHEIATGNKIGLELKLIAGSMELDPACDQILAGLDAGHWRIIPGFKAKATAFAAQRLPSAFNLITMGLIRKIMRKHGMPVA